MNNTLKTTLLLGALTALIIAIGGWAGGQSGMIVALLIAAITNFISYWYSDKIVLHLYGAREIDVTEEPGLHRAVRQLAHSAGIPMPRLYMIDADTPNAFATGRNPQNAAVAVTRGLLHLCSDSELVAILGHELSHVRNRDILVSSVAATLAGAIMVIASVLRWGLLFGFGHRDESGRGPLATLALVILAPIAAMLIQLGISRAREYEADLGGARLTHAPLELASALRKLANFNARYPLAAQPATAHLFIVNPLSSGAIANLFATHPPIEERIRRLEGMAIRSPR
jgi:heat shock protein HtpX